MATPESKVKERVRAYLKSEKVWFYQPMQNGMGRVGIPDFVCCWNGKFLGIETKAPGKRGATTANQERVLQEIKDHGGLSIVVDDVAQLMEYFHKLKAQHG